MLEITICDDEKKLRNDLRHIAGTQLELSGLEYHITEAGAGKSFCEEMRNGLRTLFSWT